jgi:hypothetical protein
MAEHGYANGNAHCRVLVLMRFAMVAKGRGTDRWDELPAHVDALVAEWLGTCLDTINRMVESTFKMKAAALCLCEVPVTAAPAASP